MYYPSAKSYFSGAGGLDLGLLQAGINVEQSLEIDKIASQTLELNFNHNVVRRDIKEITVLEQIESDILVGTYPCNHYSNIADIHGTRTGDELYLHFFRHIAISQPEAYVLENVPGMKKFPVVMEAMSKLPNYYINIFCPIDALNWLPQRRERLILIGTKRNIKIEPPKNTKRVRMSEIIEKDAIINVPNYVLKRLNGGYRDKPIIVDPDDENAFAPTCVAHYSKDRGTRLVIDKNYKHGVRPFTVREYARLQGFPDWFRFVGSDADIYKQIGNAVPVPMGEWVGKQLIKYFN